MSSNDIEIQEFDANNDIEVFDNFFDTYEEELKQIINTKEINEIINIINTSGFDFKYSLIKNDNIKEIVDTLSILAHLNKYHKNDLERQIKESVNLEQDTISLLIQIINKIDENGLLVLQTLYYSIVSNTEEPRLSMVSNPYVSIQEIIDENNKSIGYSPYVNLNLNFNHGAKKSKYFVKMPYDEFKSLLKFLNKEDKNLTQSIDKYKSKINEIVHMED